MITQDEIKALVMDYVAKPDISEDFTKVLVQFVEFLKELVPGAPFELVNSTCGCFSVKIDKIADFRDFAVIIRETEVELAKGTTEFTTTKDFENYLMKCCTERSFLKTCRYLHQRFNQ